MPCFQAAIALVCSVSPMCVCCRAQHKVYFIGIQKEKNVHRSGGTTRVLWMIVVDRNQFFPFREIKSYFKCILGKKNLN